jgi:hypothetical protein
MENNKQDLPEVMTLTEVAQLCRRCTKTIATSVMCGDFPGRKLEGRYVFLRSQVMDFLAGGSKWKNQ